MEYSQPRLARQLAPALHKLLSDSVEHGPQTAPLLPDNVADFLTTLSAFSSLITLIVSAAYTSYALITFVISKMKKQGARQ